jgi:hypothetical protein
MGIYSGPPSASDGLVLYLDAANSASYSGSGNTWYDLSGNSNKATFVDSPSFQSAPQSFFNFDGSNDYMTIVRSSSMSPASGLTQEVWFNFSTIPNAAIFIGLQYGSSYNNTYALWKDSSLLYGGVNTSGSFSAIGIGISNISGNKWHNFVHTYDGSAQRLYLDGVLLNSSNITGSIQYDANNTRVLIGADDNGGGYNTGAGYFHSGKINQIKIYNRALSAAEIFQNYNASKKRYFPEENIVTNGLVLYIDPSKPSSYAGSGNTIYDISGSGKTGTFTNGPTFSGLNGGSIVFDGSNDYILFPNSDVMGSVYTQNIWFKKNSSNVGLLVDTGYAGALVYSGSIVFYYTNVSPYTLTAYYSFTIGAWYCLSLVRGSSTKEIYLNGNILASTASTDMYDAPGTNLTVGSNGGSQEFLNGNIGQVQIYNRALSAVEVQQNYNATKGRFGY